MAVSQKGFQLEALVVYMDPLDERPPVIPEGGVLSLAFKLCYHLSLLLASEFELFD